MTARRRPRRVIPVESKSLSPMGQMLIDTRRAVAATRPVAAQSRASPAPLGVAAVAHGVVRVRHDGPVNALVTGGAGFIGGAIARALIARGDTVTVIDNLIGSAPDRVPDGARFIEGDIRDLQTVTDAAAGAEVVFHQAALRSVPQSVDDPVLTTECNVVGTMNVLIAAERQGAGRVVYASSSSAYGDEAATPQQEDARPNPISPYAASKLAGEHYCRVWTKVHGLPTVSLRYFNVFGPGQNPE